MKVSVAIKLAGGSQAELARVLGVTRAAVNLWTKVPRKDVPELYVYKLQAVKPEWFR